MRGSCCSRCNCTQAPVAVGNSVHDHCRLCAQYWLSQVKQSSDVLGCLVLNVFCSVSSQQGVLLLFLALCLPTIKAISGIASINLRVWYATIAGINEARDASFLPTVQSLNATLTKLLHTGYPDDDAGTSWLHDCMSCRCQYDAASWQASYTTSHMSHCDNCHKSKPAMQPQCTRSQCKSDDGA